MASILPVSDLRNYNEVLKKCHKGEPVYLTKNGRGRFVVIDIEDYERERAEKTSNETSGSRRSSERWRRMAGFRRVEDTCGGVRC